MEELEALIPGICKFLEEDLSQEALSSVCRFRWLQLLERLEILKLGESPPRPGVTLRPPKASRKARSLPNKRFSLPTNALTPQKSLLEDMYEEPSRLLQPTYELKEADVEESSGTEFENDEADDAAAQAQDIMLPKKAPTRRMSSSNFLDQPWTLVGPLSHRYKLQKWQRLAFCVLAGLRLTGFKSTHSANPSLTVFLSGYTAIYAERDTGMAHVVKLTHPHQETHVIAADTEEQALVWAEQVNQYSRGITPSEVKSFMEQSVVQDGQEDSGFSAPVSSGSEGGSGDGGMDGSAAALQQQQQQQQQAAAAALAQPRRSIGAASPIHVSVAAGGACTATVTTSMASCRPVVEGPAPLGVVTRGSGLISSMRRKVESLNARRKSRKSLASFLPVHFTPADDAILTGVASLRLINPGAAGGLPVGWVERWCQLRPGKLETYRLDSPAVEMDVNLEGVSLGLSNDKKHRAALRLSSPDPGVDLLLFEVQDKIQMGSWIRGFIQALGIIPSVPYEAIVDWLPCESTTAGTCNEEPVYDEVASPVGAAGPSASHSARCTPTSGHAQSPTPSLSSAPNRLAPLPPLPIQMSSCITGISAGGSSDPSADYYYGSSRNSVQTVVEAPLDLAGAQGGAPSERQQMEERRRRLAELVNRRKAAGGASSTLGGHEPLYFEYEQMRRLLTSSRSARGHRRASSDPIDGALTQPTEPKLPALAGPRAVRPQQLAVRAGPKMEPMDVDDDYEATLKELQQLGAPPPPPPPPAAALQAPAQTPGGTSVSAGSTPTSSSSCSGGGGQVALRPRSLLRKTSVEMAHEEMENLRQDIALLRRKKSDLRRSGVTADTDLRTLDDEIRLKDERLRSLEQGSGRRRFSLLLSPATPNENRTFLDGLPFVTGPE